MFQVCRELDVPTVSSEQGVALFFMRRILGLSFSSSCAVSWIKLFMFYHVCLVDGSEISLLSHQLAYFKSFCLVDGPKILLLSHQLSCFRVLKRGGRFLCLELSHVDVSVFKEM